MSEQAKRKFNLFLIHKLLTEEKTLKERVFIISIISFFFFTFIGIIINLIISLPIWVIAFFIFAFFFQIPIIWFGVYKKKIRTASFLFLITLYSTATVAWFGNGGSNSANAFFFMIILFLSVLVIDSHKLIVTLINISLVSCLYMTHYLIPEMIVDYKNEEEKLFDLIASYISIAVYLVLILDLLLRSYLREHRIASEQNFKLQELNEKLLHDKELFEKMAITDPLTNLYNRGKIIELMEAEMARYERKKTSFSVILGDVDHFKQINDTYGHIAGDMVLQSVAYILQSSLRKYDSVGRYGGEEFLVILPGTNIDEARDVAERIRKEIENMDCIFPPNTIKTTISLGVANITENENLKELLSRVDEYLYIAKNEGRNRVITL